jgi:bacterioferritin (cytochrome b1)
LDRTKIDKLLNDLFEKIKHGDQEHQDWLKNSIEEFKQ